MGKGSAPPAPTSQTVNQTNLPAWAQPYSENILGKAEALTDTNKNPYTPYTGQKTADFTPMQQQAFNNVGNMQPNAATGAGIDVAANVARQAGQYGNYQPQQFGNQYQGQNFNNMGLGYLATQNPNLQSFQMQGPQDVRGAQTQAAQLNAAPTYGGTQFQGPQDVRGAQTQAAQLNAAPTYGGTQFQGPQNVGAERVGTQNFNDPATAQSYMNPYTQNVVNIQQREAQRNADIATTGRNAQASRVGAFGGSRQAIENAEAARNLATQKGDIQAQGLNTAYNQAQQAFQTDQARQLQAQQANQQTGLQAGMSNQQMGYNTNLQNAQLRQQAGLATQGLMGQYGLQQGQFNQAANLANQQTRQQADLANQQMGYNTNLQNAQLGQQAGLANQQMAGQYGLQQGQFNQAANLANQQTRQQANLANQQMGYNVGNTNLQAQLGVQQLGSGQNMQSQLANQGAYGQMQGLGMQQNLAGNQQAMQNAQLAAQYGLAGQQGSEQSRQFGSNLGLQGLQQQLAAAGQLGQLGQQQYGQQMGINQVQQGVGAQQQAMNQQNLTDQYQNFLNQQNYPYKQLGFMSDILHGTPTGQTTTSQSTAAPPSMWSNIAGLGQLGLGAAAIGRSGLFGGKEGGAVKNYAEGGIASLPDISASKQVAINATRDQLGRGQTPASPELVPELQTMLALYQKAKEVPATAPEQGDTVMRDLLNKVSQAPVPAPAPVPMQPPMGMPPQAPQQPPMQTMAGGGLASLPSANFNDDSFVGGGIIAFANTGYVDPDLFNMEVMDSEAKPLNELDEAQRKRVIAERTAARDAAKTTTENVGKPGPAPETVAEKDTGIKRAKELADRRMPQAERDMLRGRVATPTPGVIEPDATLKASAKPAGTQTVAGRTAGVPLERMPPNMGAPTAPAGLAATPEGTAAAEGRVAGNPAVANEVAKLDARIAEGVRRGKDMSKLIAQRAALTQGLGATAPAAATAAAPAGLAATPQAAAGAAPAGAAPAAAGEAGLKSLVNDKPGLIRRALNAGPKAFSLAGLGAGSVALPLAYEAGQLTGEAMNRMGAQEGIANLFENSRFNPFGDSGSQATATQETRKGAADPNAVFGVIAKGETGKPWDTLESLGTMARDTNNSRSYGSFGFNSQGGAKSPVGTFVTANPQLGIKGEPGTTEFNRSWTEAVRKDPKGMAEAQAAFAQQTYVAPAVAALAKVIPAEAVKDPRITAYFADRQIQLGRFAQPENVKKAWEESKGDTRKFLFAMNKYDTESLGTNFKNALAQGNYSPEGHATRLEKRLNGALGLNVQSTPTPKTPKDTRSTFEVAADVARGAPGKIADVVRETVSPGTGAGRIAAATQMRDPTTGKIVDVPNVKPLDKPAAAVDELKENAANAAFAKAEEAKAKGNKVDADKYFNIGMALMASGAGTLGGDSQYAMRNIGKGLGQGLGTYAELSKQDKAEKREEQRLGETIRAHRATEANNRYRIFESGLQAAAKRAFPTFEQMTPAEQSQAETLTRLRYLKSQPVEEQRAMGYSPEFLRQQEAMLGSTTSGGSKADPRFKVEKVGG